MRVFLNDFCYYYGPSANTITYPCKKHFVCQRVFVFPGARPFAWPPILALAPSLYLPALAPNLYLPALAANLYLPAAEWGNYGYSYHPIFMLIIVFLLPQRQ